MSTVRPKEASGLLPGRTLDGVPVGLLWELSQVGLKSSVTEAVVVPWVCSLHGDFGRDLGPEAWETHVSPSQPGRSSGQAEKETSSHRSWLRILRGQGISTPRDQTQKTFRDLALPCTITHSPQVTHLNTTWGREVGKGSILEFSREREPIGGDLFIHLSIIYLPTCLTWGWRMRSPNIYIWQLEPQESWRWSFCLSLKAEGWCPSVSRTLSSHDFIGWSPAPGEGNLLCSFYWWKCSFHPETPSETHPDNVWPDSGHPMAQSSCHIRLTFTGSHLEIEVLLKEMEYPLKGLFMWSDWTQFNQDWRVSVFCFPFISLTTKWEIMKGDRWAPIKKITFSLHIQPQIKIYYVGSPLYLLCNLFFPHKHTS